MEVPDISITSLTPSTSTSGQTAKVRWNVPNWQTPQKEKEEKLWRPSLKRISPTLSADKKFVTKNSAYAFICDCAAPNREYFCDHIFNLLQSGGDFPLWAVSKNMEQAIFVPIIPGILYHIDVESVTIPTWNGGEETKILIRPGNGILSERFVDSMETVMKRWKWHQSTVLESFRKEVIEHVEEAPRANEISNLIRSSPGNPGIFCKSKSHDYGINSRFYHTIMNMMKELDLNKKHTNLANFIKLNSYTGYLYQMCFLCYENHNSLFNVTTL